MSITAPVASEICLLNLRRRRYQYFDLPDDIILRALIGERKKGMG
ncbi:MAG: hypothetical protein WD894_12545 [Pirellulales bacterium]